MRTSKIPIDTKCFGYASWEMSPKKRESAWDRSRIGERISTVPFAGRVAPGGGGGGGTHAGAL
eukprot:SAG31_NODE_14395_length_809_cov_1.398592_3_plen_62_part_01